MGVTASYLDLHMKVWLKVDFSFLSEAILLEWYVRHNDKKENNAIMPY